MGEDIIGKGTGPWYIDPSVNADSGTTLSAQAQENHPDTTGINMSNPDPATGYCGYDNCTGYGRYRVYYQIGINPILGTKPTGAPQPPTIYGSTFYGQATAASNPGASSPLGLYSVSGTISTDTTWGNQPCNGSLSGCSKVGDSFSITGTGPISYDVTSTMRQAVSGNWGNWTVAIIPDSETNPAYRHRLSNNPHITTTYDITPSIWGAHTAPTPGFANTNTPYSCTTGGAHPWDNPAWVGANQNVSLVTSSWSPANLNLHTVFRIWDDNNSSWGQVLDSGWTGSWNPNGVSVGIGSLTDGHQYGWTANAFDYASPDTGLGSSETPWCYFRVDKTPPGISVASADWPPSGTPNNNPAHFAGDTTGGAFTVTGTDPAPATGSASGIGCFRWTADPAQAAVTGWHCTDGQGAGIVPATQVAGTNNYTGSFSYVPGLSRWGTNIVYVQAQDNAGNYTQPVAYSFYAPWNKDSKPLFGDTTGDARPDLLTPDAAGNLRMVNAKNDPAGSPAAAGISAPFGQDPGYPGTTWKDYQITHRGSLGTSGTVDDVIVHSVKPGSDLAASLFKATNDGAGHFDGTQSALTKPSTCKNAAKTTIACPAGYTAGDWSNTSQVLAFGTPTGEGPGPKPGNPSATVMATQTTLLAVENGSLWLYTPNFGGDLAYAQQLSTSTNWNSYDLIAPGQASGQSTTATAGGTTYTRTIPTLWARSKADGSLHSYSVTRKADGTPDYSALADPAAGTITGAPSATTGAYPTVSSDGDLTGDGIPDLWALDTTGKLVVWTGTGTPGNVTGFNSVIPLADLRTPTGHWPLNDPAGSTTAADTTNQHPGQITGTVTFGQATVGTTTGNVATFTGNGSITAPGANIDTGNSFTVSAWIKPDAAQGVSLSSDGANTSGFIVWPDSDGRWYFGLSTTDSGWSYDLTNLGVTSAGFYRIGRWDKITASYNASSGIMSLYVNGALASTGYHTQKSGINGPLTLGRYKYNGAPNSPFKGGISDVTALPRATDPWSSEARAITLSAPNNGKCLDLAGGTAANGTAVQLWDCDPNLPGQKWSIRPDGTIRVLGGCLDAIGGGTGNGTPLEYWPCPANGPAANQLFIPVGDGSLYNPASGRCVDVTNANTANGTRIQLYNCNTTPAQRWTFTPAA